jgi:Tol biopolymer transport system component
MSEGFPKPNFLTAAGDYTDYRPTMGPGQLVIFERTPSGGGSTMLYKITSFTNRVAVPFLPNSGFQSQTRPDISRTTLQVAFNGVRSDAPASRVWITDINGNNVRPVGAEGSYPTWSLAGAEIVTENFGQQASPRPCDSVFTVDGRMRFSNVNGADQATAVPLYGGMPTVGPADLPQIAFAGQPARADWGGSTSTEPTYDQEKNYIFINQGIFSSAPMERGVPTKFYDPKHQARAPAWSFGGETIAFESNRSGKGYAIYLYHFADQSVTQVTDPSFDAQHAKFFPNGSKLIFAIRYTAGKGPPRGIAWVDISGLLKS